MAADNQLQLYIRSGAVQQSIEQTLKNRADDFTTSLLTVINSNPLLQECDAKQVLHTALKAASMRLPIDPSLGLAYIIPYRNKVKVPIKYTDENGVEQIKMYEGRDGKMYPSTRDEYRYEAQLQVGWKGFIQLAHRTGLYHTIHASGIRKGEYKGENYLTGTIDFKFIKDKDVRTKRPVAGYVAYFRLHDGFEKMLYMSVEELEKHAKQYSKSYQKGFGKWVDDKPSMSRKTVVKLLLSKWGPQSTEMQKAFRADQAAMGDDDAYNYVDNKPDQDEHSDGSSAPQSQKNGVDAAQNNKSGGDVIDGEVVDNA